MTASHRIALLAVFVAGLSWTTTVLADSYRRSATDATWKAECGSCHLAYPAEMLPAASWRALMSGLDKHFGADASVDPATAVRITAFLEQNARRAPASSAPPVLRVTESSWFARKHRKVSDAVWKRPTIKSAANCVACHAGAERGDYEDDNVRIPK